MRLKLTDVDADAELEGELNHILIEGGDDFLQFHGKFH